MREADERAVWNRLAAAARGRGERSVSVLGVELDLARGCTVVAGRNGAGKSQVLAAADAELTDMAVHLQLHKLCEHALATLASRSDISEMEAETGALVLDSEILDHVKRVVGRDYDDVQWFALELEPSDEFQESFRWPGDQILVPHFRVTYRGVEYSSLQMGLGELSVHVLFWVLQQYRDLEGVTLLLDEPDAYLPPVGSARMLARVQDVCLRRKWDLVVSTHSEEMIRTACDNDGLLLLRRGAGAVIESACSWIDGPDIASELLPPPHLDLLLFCEDESAAALVRSLLRTGDTRRARAASVIWKDGEGYLTALSQHLPRYPGMKIRFGLVYDGDQREGAVEKAAPAAWPSVFLPTSLSPDELFKSLAAAPASVAERLQVTESTVVGWFDALEGADPHDWVNGLCDRHGVRTAALDALADLWTSDHVDDCKTFLTDLESGLL